MAADLEMEETEKSEQVASMQRGSRGVDTEVDRRRFPRRGVKILADDEGSVICRPQ
jgi:hypothetical protein